MLLAGLTALAVVVAPVPNTGVDYQLGGSYALPAGVGIVSRDWREQPAAGAFSICYINAFQAQPQSRRWWLGKHPELVLPVVDKAWNEILLDTSSQARRIVLARIMGRWIDACASKGFQAVEPDNLDSWQRSRGRLTRADNVAFARLLIQRAHAAGLAIAQKNAVGLAQRTLFDFAVVEQCQRYQECDRFQRAYGDQVIEIEYRRRDFDAACSARGAQLPIVWRDLQLKRPSQPGYRFATC